MRDLLLLRSGRRPIVKHQSYLIAIKIDLQHAIDRLADDGELVKRGTEQFFLQRTVHNRDQYDEASMQWLGRIETPEIARIVRNEDKIARTGVAHDIPVLPPCSSDMGDVLGVMTCLPGNGNQVDGETFVDQKPHDTVMVSMRRRARCEGF